MRLWPAPLLVAACVKGNPDGGGGDFDENGGTIAIEGCGYSVTTRLGAEPPKPGMPIFGPEPTPIPVHLGLMKDPKTWIVVQWRTVDEIATKASTIRYAAGAGLSAEQLTQTANGITFGFKSTGTLIHQVHQAHLCNLTPGT